MNVDLKIRELEGIPDRSESGDYVFFDKVQNAIAFRDWCAHNEINCSNVCTVKDGFIICYWED
jgi:hypothetical protein